jgi:hypothetical protein
MATSRKENITELAAQFGRTADRLRAKEAEQQALVRQGSDSDVAEMDANQVVDLRRRRRKCKQQQQQDACDEESTTALLNEQKDNAVITESGACARCSPVHPLRLPHRNRAALTSAAVSTAQLDNSGDEGEEQIGVVKDYSGSGLRISGIEGLCRIPGAGRGLMTNITMKECLESASMWVACAAGRMVLMLAGYMFV